MASTSHDVNGNDVKNGNDVGINMVIPHYKHAEPKHLIVNLLVFHSI